MANINFSALVASSLGALLGQNLIRVKRRNIDPDYSNKERDRVQRMAIPVWLYGIERIRIKKAELITIDGEDVVQFNDVPELQLSLAGAKDINDIIKKPTLQEVINAIEKEEGTKVPAFFVDDEMATKIAASCNERSRKGITQMMEVLAKQASNLSDANNIMFDACRNELSKVGKDVSFSALPMD